MPTEEERERAKKGIRARQDAIKTLIDRYAEEFQGLVESNRVALGLPRRPNMETPQQLEAKLRAAEERAAKLRRELELAQRDAALAR